MLLIQKIKFNIQTMLKIHTKKPSIKLISDNDNNKEKLSNKTPEPVPGHLMIWNSSGWKTIKYSKHNY